MEGCLAAHWEVCELWGADPWVIQVLRFGYRVPFRTQPPLSRVPLPPPNYSPTSIRGLALAAAVVAFQEREAIEPAPPSPGYYSRLFLTPKFIGGWRPVIDLSRLNGWVAVSHFHMETAQLVLQSLCPWDLMVSLDLQDAYLQGPVHPSSRRYLRFCMGELVSQFRALCFGLSTALQANLRHGPGLFGHASLRVPHPPVSRQLACSGFLLLQDRSGERFSPLALSTTRDSDQHSQEFSDSQSLDYLGMRIHTVPLRVFLTLKRIQKLSSLIQAFLSDRLYPLSVWRHLRGVMSSVSALVPGARLRMRSLKLRLNVAGSLLRDEDPVSWDDSCLPDLWWWSDVSHLQAGLHLESHQPHLFLFTDASDLS